MTESDLPLVLHWRNQPHIRQNMYTDHTITPDEHAAWFAGVSADGSSVPQLFECEKRPLGVVNFSDFARHDERCRWGFYIGEPGARKGLGTVLGILAMEFAFGSLGMRKVTGEAFAFNEASLRLHRRLGFFEEGRLIAHVHKNGRYEDIIVMAHFAEHWASLKDSLTEKYLSEGVTT
ncbi:MAG: UDP-4-amino-4,6-dideoxy-N-acetyl-beta-L-altrosamine N-acetyltransferase [Candidatus Zixiibacteriota bacterium]